MASQPRGTLYLGVTGDLAHRIGQHRTGNIKGFTQRYDVKMLVWYQHFQDVRTAIAQETRMKGWKRDWKIRVIEERNPNWDDLALLFNYPPLTPRPK